MDSSSEAGAERARTTADAPHGAGAPSAAAVLGATVPRTTRRVVTVLFCDMAESTAMSERLDPEALRILMLRYYAVARESLEQHGGTVEKFIGDAVVAVFGVPRVREDDALRAARAALSLREAVAGLNADFAASLGVRVSVRIGINTGEVAVSDGGEEPAQTGHVLTTGEVVNVAARLQERAGRDGILLGDATRGLIGHRAEAEPVGPLPLRGTRRPMRAWRLLGMTAGGAGLEHASVFVDRSAELAALTSIFAAVRQDGAGCLVRLLGEPGIGKSRLAHEFAEAARAQGALVAVGGCRPWGGEGSLAALAEAIGQLVAQVAGDAGGDLGEAAALLRGGLLRDGALGTDPRETYWAASVVVREIARARPVVLILDDLQWATAPLFDALAFLSERIGRAPVVVLCVARSDLLEGAPRWDAWPHAASLTVPPLGPGDSARLVAELVGTSAHAETAGADLVERAEGNPLFLEQLAQMVMENWSDEVPQASASTDTDAAAGAHPAASKTSMTVPLTIAAVLAARLERLEPAERRLVEYASVLGRDFTRAELRAVCDPNDDVAPAVFDSLVRRRLFQPSADRDPSAAAYRITSALLVEIAYGGMPRLMRAESHERYAHWSAGTGGSADLVGTHLERAWTHRTALEPFGDTSRGLRREAARWLSTAGAAALRHGDLHRADDLLRRAAALCPAGEPGHVVTVVRLAEARLLMGTEPQWPRQARTLLAEAAAAHETVPAAHLRLLLAYADSSGDQFSASLRAAEDALPVFQAAGDELGLARAHLRIGQAGQAEGRYADCGRSLLRAVRHAETADSELELATALGGLALSQWMGPVPVATGVARCRELLTRNGAGRRAARATVNCSLAVLLAMDGAFAEAEALLAEALRIVLDMGHAYAAAALPLFQAEVAFLAADPDRAVRLLSEAAPACAALGDRQLASSAYRELARVTLDLHRLDDAARAADAAAHAAEPSASSNADLRGIDARIAAARGQSHGARLSADAAVAVAWTTDSPACRATALLDLAHTEFALGDDAAALDAAARARALFSEKGHLPGAGWARALAERIGGEAL